MTIETIHESLLNGQRQQAVKQIDEYGVYDFWQAYYDYLNSQYAQAGYPYFSDMTISYFRIKGR